MSHPIPESDVLIVGAGPAGCTAGILLARRGFRVHLLEKNPPGRHKICGDLLGPRSLQFLEALHIGWEARAEPGFPIHGLCVYDESRLRSVACFPPGPQGIGMGLTVRRDRFDSFLHEKAAEAGCRFFHGVRFTGGAGTGANSLLVRGSSRDGERRFLTRMLLGADGVGSAVSRAAGLQEKRSDATIVAVRGYYENVKRLRNAIEIYFVPRFQPGYAWVIPLDRRRANIGVGIRADACIGNQIRIRKELQRFIRLHPALSRRMEEARETGAPRGWPIGTYRRTQKTFASHALLLGDAAGLVDPLSGEGVFGAMQSAWIAARVTEEALNREEFSCAFLRRYEERCRRFFDADFRSAALLTGLLAHRSLGAPLALWGLKRVEKTCNLDPQYARVVAGFFTGMQPRKRFFKTRWILKTLFG